MKSIGDPKRNSGLSGPGIASEAHMQRRRGLRKAEALARAIDQQQCGGLPDTLLDGFQTNEFAVQFRQHLGEAGLAIL